MTACRYEHNKTWAPVHLLCIAASLIHSVLHSSGMQQRIMDSRCCIMQRPYAMQPTTTCHLGELGLASPHGLSALQASAIFARARVHLNKPSAACLVTQQRGRGMQVRDGKVGIADSEEGLVVTNLVAQRAKGKQRAAEGDTEMAMRLQFLMAYDMEDWRDWKTYYRREECRMRHRQPSQAPASAAQRPRQEVRGLPPSARQAGRF